MLIKKVVAESKLSGAQVARDAGISVATFESWTGGRRNPTEASLKRIAAGLRKRAARITKLAEQLEREAER